MPFLRALLLLIALALPAFAQAPHYNEAQLLPAVKDLANQLQLYLDNVAKAGSRPDFSRPPVSDQFSRLFDPGQLAALPPPQAGDLPWLLDWTHTANGIAKAILYFGIAPPADPAATAAAIKRNMTDYEDQQAAAISFMIRLDARDAEALSLFMAQLKPDARTPVRLAGYDKARAGSAETILGALVTIAQGMKPDNDRRLSAALRDTGDVWARQIRLGDRPAILGMAAKAAAATKDDKTRENLALFGATLAAAN